MILYRSGSTTAMGCRMASCPVLEHNLDPSAFMWLWAKYVRGYNPSKHCTNSLLGKYSKLLSGHSDLLTMPSRIPLNEISTGEYAAIYICGVSKDGYRKRENYPHNLHAVIRPAKGQKDSIRFEDWSLSVENGLFMPIPTLEQIPEKYRGLSASYTTCRIFRWAVANQPSGSTLNIDPLAKP